MSLAMINELAGVLDTTSTYLTGYDTQEKPLTNMADVMQFLFSWIRSGSSASGLM